MTLQGLDTLDKLTAKTEESGRAIESIYQSITKTNESSAKIGEASDLIKSIAEQTNLLALSAAIEAAGRRARKGVCRGGGQMKACRRVRFDKGH